ncbi:hypothetical protein LA080_016067 [Diaporthe eres]|nr:hypothetical protein LA080_016067 [Diaporthe eres]
MPPRPSDQPRPRLYILGKRFRLRPREDAIGWRMKQIIEVKDYSEWNEAFHVYCRNITWVWRTREFGTSDWRFHLPPNGNRVPTVAEPLW